MTKSEALEAAQSAPQPIQDLLNELIEQVYGTKKPKRKATRRAAKKITPPPSAPES